MWASPTGILTSWNVRSTAVVGRLEAFPPGVRGGDVADVPPLAGLGGWCWYPLARGYAAANRVRPLGGCR
jgi:hypothetical protein